LLSLPVDERQIEAPPRAGRAGVVLILAAISGFSSVMFLSGPALWGLFLGLAVIGAAGALLREPAALAAGAFGALSVLMLKISGLPWPAPIALALVVYGLLALPLRGLRPSLRFLRRGLVNRRTVVLIIAMVAVAGGALTIWYFVAEPDLADLVGRLPKVPLWSLILGSVLFAVINAAVEEAAWRGLWLQALDAAFGPGAISLVVQAASFGLLHIHGFPRGWAGVLLATFFGGMMGYLRRRSGGLLAPWLAHVGADLTVLALLGLGS
jgi:membrane protease YdiL (CAAX protease family)